MHSNSRGPFAAPTRRSFLLSTAGIAAIAVAGPKLAFADDGTFKATSGDTVYFRGWQFMPDIVVENVKNYNEANAGKVDYQTVTGDYPVLMEKSLVAKDKLDIIYGNPPTMVRFMEAGWIEGADDVPNADAAKADLYDGVRELWTYKGKLLGLSYFLATRGVVAVNRARQEEVGIKDEQLPKDWDAFYAQLDELSAKGHKDIYLPHWFNEYYGISWSFLFEVLNRGGKIIDPETHEPAVTVDGPAGKVLTAWKKAWNSGQIPQEVLTYTEANIVDGFASGRFLYSPQACYNLAYFNTPEKSKIAGKVGFLPYRGQSWGLLDSALYVKTKRDRSPEFQADVNKFVSWYGYKNNEGKVGVGSRWMKEAMLFSGYKSVMESPETKASMDAKLARKGDTEELLEIYKSTKAPTDVWLTVYAEEFNAWLRKRLSDFVLNDQPVDGVIADITKQVNSLNKKYKIKT